MIGSGKHSGYGAAIGWLHAHLLTNKMTESCSHLILNLGSAVWQGSSERSVWCAALWAAGATLPAGLPTLTSAPQKVPLCF